MPTMTKADWNQWSEEKRKFYAELFACYLIADDGMLRLDAEKRRNLVRAQLVKQSAPGAEPIITRSHASNYVIADGLQADGRSLKTAAEADRIKVLCSQRGDLQTMHGAFPMLVQGQVEMRAEDVVAKADEASANNEPVQHSILGGFYKPAEQTIEAHFAAVLKTKMLRGQETRFAEHAVLLSLGDIDDLTFFSRCALHPDEMTFLLEDPTFTASINKEAHRLASQVMKGTMAEGDIERRMLAHIHACSAKKTNAKPLAELSIPRVHTHLALFTSEIYNRLAQWASDNLSVVGAVGFVGESKGLKRYLEDGLLSFTFPPEFRNFLKASFLMKGPFAGQPVQAIKAHTANFIAQADLVPALSDMLMEISRGQIADIKSSALPQPPADMGIKWDLRRSPEKILNIIRGMQCINLYAIAEMAGFSKENAHLAFGLGSGALLDEINQNINHLWDQESDALLTGVARGLKREEEELSAYWRERGKATLDHLKAEIQPSGISLGVLPPKALPLAAPREIGLFGGPAAAAEARARQAAQERLAAKMAHQGAVPAPAAALAFAAAPERADIQMTAEERARKAAQDRLAAREALLAAQKREALLAAAAQGGPADDADQDERERMLRS